MKTLCATALFLLAAIWPASVIHVAVAKAADSAVVLMYHRFGENTFPSTNIRLEQFEAHIKTLKEGRYTVLPVPQIVDAIRQGKSLPDRTVGITIDDAYLSVFEQAWPRLQAADLPFTLFAATEAIDQGLRGFMSWDQIRTLRDAGVTIGAHSASHNHMPASSDARNSRELEISNQRFKAELGAVPDLFAYPFGEAGTEVEALVRATGYGAAFGQQSGAVYKGANPFHLPRFALNERFGEMNRFRLVINALPLPVSDLVPADTVIGAANPPPVGFTIDPSAGSLDRLSCFASTEGQLTPQRLGPRRIELRLANPFPAGRSRINCTMPTAEGRWRWLGLQYVVPGSQP